MWLPYQGVKENREHVQLDRDLVRDGGQMQGGGGAAPLLLHQVHPRHVLEEAQVLFRVSGHGEQGVQVAHRYGRGNVGQK